MRLIYLFIFLKGFHIKKREYRDTQGGDTKVAELKKKEMKRESTLKLLQWSDLRTKEWS